MSEKKRLAVGILAHVDAGKTTLSEAMLYLCGALRKAGRVDHGDTLLDNDEQERQRGITIFSKMARLPLPQAEITLLDTPGHVDFSAEAERTLQVLDYAILVVSGSEGVQSHTETLWRLLKSYNVPTFIFVNKTDLPGPEKDALLADMKKRLDTGIIDFSLSSEERAEELALCDESMMEKVLEGDAPDQEDVIAAIRARKVFPCRFGSALKQWGVEELLADLQAYTVMPAYGSRFGARVFKIMSDERGERLTCVKITGGTLRAKDTVRRSDAPEEEGAEKINRIRLYSGPRFEQVEEAPSGTVCALSGLTHTLPGDGLGEETSGRAALLEPVLTCRVIVPNEVDERAALLQLKKLQEEDPQLHIRWDEQAKEIRMDLMGEVQTEVLARLVQNRYGWTPSFGPGGILYKETVLETVEGCGHFEPLRHYAEVHLLLQPGKPGSGIVLKSGCREDELDRNWQRLILTHLAEKTHKGVLLGAPLTDVKITLIGGRAHKAHTEGGDFRQATYRAVRHGLRCGRCGILEPWCSFKMELPCSCVGRAMTELEQLGAKPEPPLLEGETAVLTGKAPVSSMQTYPAELVKYTSGKGRISTVFTGYEPCHNPEEVMAKVGYDPDSDLFNTADSVFCAHGSGFVVPWQEAAAHMHVETGWGKPQAPEAAPIDPEKLARRAKSYAGTLAQDKELMAIFERTYGPIKKEVRRRAFKSPEKESFHPGKAVPAPAGPEYLLVDGYNIIFAWPELKKLAAESLDAARVRLTDILCNYRGFAGCELILVFDAYKVKGNPGSIEQVSGISVVYTREAETADMYIEKVTRQIGQKHRVRVATSDGLEQIIILGAGALRLSASAFLEEVERAEKAIRDALENI